MSLMSNYFFSNLNWHFGLFIVTDTTKNFETVRLPEKELIYWAQDFEPEADIDTVDEAVNSLEENDFVVDRVM